MKKLLALLLAVMLVLSFTACGKNETAEALTLGGTLKEEFLEITKGGETDPYAIAETLMANELIQFMPVVTEIDPGTYLQGFNDGFEVTGYDKCSMFAPMIGSIPFIGYIFSLSEGEDADAFVKALEENANLRWNICVSADEVNTAASESTVFFLMSPLALEQEASIEGEIADETMEEIPMDAPAAVPSEGFAE